MAERPDVTVIGRAVVSILAWLGLACAGAWLAVQSLWRSPALAMMLIGVIGLVSGMGVIVSAGAIAEVRRFRKTGYRVKLVGSDVLVYEEASSEGTREVSLTRRRVDVGEWHQPGWEVALPREDLWDDRMPAWLKGRRGEILERIPRCFGGGTPFLFRDI